MKSYPIYTEDRPHCFYLRLKLGDGSTIIEQDFDPNNLLPKIAEFTKSGLLRNLSVEEGYHVPHNNGEWEEYFKVSVKPAYDYC